MTCWQEVQRLLASNSDQHSELQREQDIERLDEWMRIYGTDVLNVAYSYVRNFSQAQDIVQDVFLRAFTKMDSFRGQSSVRTWLLSITANRCKDVLRSWNQRNVTVEETVELGETHSTPETEVIEQLENNELWAAVSQLPLKYREVIVLFYLREFSGQEIAEILGTTEQNIRNQASSWSCDAERNTGAEGVDV